ncbi:unnamed protein product [Prorocentrum cordatum]|uniref:Uncharacterized protein n=1 Tax=Prorocentrum cordatum TaxID=2364126 RepID=A0ABN9UMJ7_9DINO|nr:unnamed protein product [Polarella glacialis]
MHIQQAPNYCRFTTGHACRCLGQKAGPSEERVVHSTNIMPPEKPAAAVAGRTCDDAPSFSPRTCLDNLQKTNRIQQRRDRPQHASKHEAPIRNATHRGPKQASASRRVDTTVVHATCPRGRILW